MNQHTKKKWNPNLRIYPCADCGKMRSKNEGGTTFTVCDDCWDKHFKIGKYRDSSISKPTESKS